MYINSDHKKAQELLMEGKYEKALTFFNKALKKSPQHPDILSHRGVAYLHLNQKKNCLEDLMLSLELDGENAYRYASLAYARDFFGDLSGAIRDYEKAIEIDPEDAISHNNLGLLLEKQGYQKKAEDNFVKADKLAKIQKEMFAEMEKHEDSMESSSSKINKPIGEKIQPKKLTPDKPVSRKQLFTSIITKKSVFREFIRFIRNGLKIK
ncbi:MAG: tetratricopeptide repeat protein [Brumimicrobium sp.]|nr:tetratricopeptide repeat protein [Brumimicrobium sp.]